MKFRPCIDIHHGAVKQLVGGSVSDEATGKKAAAEENFVSNYNASEYADLYRENRLSGGHVIILDPAKSEYYEKDLEQVKGALAAFPNGLQVGGGINSDNAELFLDFGASHVIVTSFVFSDGKIRYDRLDELKYVVGRKHIVLDLSARIKDNDYYIVTDRWQKFTTQTLDKRFLQDISYYCDEILVHAVDVEGKKAGVDETLLSILSGSCDIPVTYAGGVTILDDIEKIRQLGNERVDFTVGSALDIFGGELAFDEIARVYR